MRHDTIGLPRPVLSDEAAATILDFLNDFTADFESVYYKQIRRHREQQETLRREERQVELPWGDSPF